MILKCEVGLIFFAHGSAHNAPDGEFAAVLMVMVTTLMAPPLLKLLFPPLPPKHAGEPAEGIGSLVTKPQTVLLLAHRFSPDWLAGVQGRRDNRNGAGAGVFLHWRPAVA